MKNKGILFLILLMVCLVGLSSCGKKEAQTATLVLPANPTTGYEWVCEQNPEIFEITSEYKEDEHEGEMVGVGGKETFLLTPQKKGSAKVVFTYMRSGNKEEVETILAYELKVDKQMQITMESMTSDIAGTMSELPEIPEMVIK